MVFQTCEKAQFNHMQLYITKTILCSFCMVGFSGYINTLRAGLLNCLNACSRGLTFRHRASCI